MADRFGLWDFRTTVNTRGFPDKKILSKKVEVTVLEVEMADDCVSTSALRFRLSQKKWQTA